MLQKSSQWHEYRGPRITASRFGDVLANTATKRYNEYKNEILDYLKGVPYFEEETPPWFKHGIELEQEAIARYEWETDTEVCPVGIKEHPKYFFIAGSPDGFVGDDGGIEVKSRRSYAEHKRCEKHGITSGHIPQVQGYLWITDRKWFDFVSYYSNNGKTLIHIFRVFADKKYHSKLESACIRFWDEIQKEFNEWQNAKAA